MNRDSYLNFLEKFNISNEDFIEYGLNDIIFVPNDKVISEWEIFKNKVYSNQEVNNILEVWVEMLRAQNICLKYTKIFLVIQI